MGGKFDPALRYVKRAAFEEADDHNRTRTTPPQGLYLPSIHTFDLDYPTLLTGCSDKGFSSPDPRGNPCRMNARITDSGMETTVGTEPRRISPLPEPDPT